MGYALFDTPVTTARNSLRGGLRDDLEARGMDVFSLLVTHNRSKPTPIDSRRRL